MHKMPAAAALLYGLENTPDLSLPVRRAAVNGHLCQNLRPQGKMDFTALQIKVAEIPEYSLTDGGAAKLSNTRFCGALHFDFTVYARAFIGRT